MPTKPSGTIEDAKTLLSSKGAFKSSVPMKADTSSAISYFMGAAQQQEYYSQAGLSLYRDSMAQAKSEIVSNYQNAIAELRPQEQASRAALNEMMRFVGIDPVPATSGLADRVQSISGTDNSALSGLIRQAESEQDPAKRAALRDQVNLAFEYAKQQSINNRQATIDQQRRSLVAPTLGSAGAKPVMPKINDLTMSSQQIADMKAEYKRQLAAWQNTQNTLQNTYNTQLADYNRQYQDILSTNADPTSQYNQLKTDFNNSYTNEYDKAYTGQQVTDMIRATPGYLAQEEAGTKAIERQGAAKGMLGSGNTLLSLQKYGQDLALGYYQQHLTNLQNIAQQGSGAAANIAQLYSQQGSLLSDISQKVGAQSAATYDLIGKGYAAAYNNAADVAFKAAQKYAEESFTGQETAKDRTQKIANTIIGNQPALAAVDQKAGESAGLAAAVADKGLSAMGLPPINALSPQAIQNLGLYDKGPGLSRGATAVGGPSWADNSQQFAYEKQSSQPAPLSGDPNGTGYLSSLAASGQNFTLVGANGLGTGGNAGMLGGGLPGGLSV